MYFLLKIVLSHIVIYHIIVYKLCHKAFRVSLIFLLRFMMHDKYN